ncbi:MAG: hypothetical protein V4440_12475 [Pseudomonadota bacterium]
MSKIQASANMSQVTPDQLQRFLDIFCSNVVDTVNGKLDFATNFNAKFLNVTFTTALTNTTAIHGLGRVPSGYIIVGLSAQMIVSDGTSQSTASAIVLQSSIAGTARLLVY